MLWLYFSSILFNHKPNLWGGKKLLLYHLIYCGICDIWNVTAQDILWYFKTLKGLRTHPSEWTTEETTAASWNGCRMMDDALRPKHHINPSAQYDSHKVAAALSSSPQAQAERQADCEEEDTLVMKRKEPDCCSSRKWSGESRRGKGDHWSKKREKGTFERELSGQQGCWRRNKGIERDLEGAAREDRPMVILWRLRTDTSTHFVTVDS